jgi:DNA-binding transcriptional LysR family regulator
VDEYTDRPLKISQLQAFVAVAQYGSFSAAALELGLSQSTVSHAIASLEAELGVMLLTRGRQGALLTFEGQQIIQEARQILELLESIRKKARLAKTLEDGQVRIATVRSIATHLLPEMIAHFRSKFPTIQVIIAEYDRYSEVEQALRDEQADVGFTVLPTTSEFDTWELIHDPFVVLLPPGSSAPDPIPWDQLISYSIILNPRSYQLSRVVREYLSQFGYTPKVDYEVREDSTIISMVKQGLGAAIIPQLAAEPIPESVQVRHLPVPLERVLGVLVLKEAILPKATFAFLDVLKEKQNF